MKLISCHIANFGNISEKDLNFEEGITSFYQPNGFGKSTIAAFLKAMFFGMKNSRSNDKEMGDRKHYFPFAGGKYGGSLTFSYKGDVYKIERFFDEKSDTRDTVVVYRNNRQYDGFGKDVGQKVFGLDSDAFERTVFIDSSEIDIGQGGLIEAKLRKVFGCGEEGYDVKYAEALLDSKISEYTSSRRKNAKIETQKALVRDLESSVSSIKSELASLPTKKKELAEKQNLLAETKAKLGASHQGELKLKDWERYDDFLRQADDWGLKAKELEARYPHGVPSKADLEGIKEAITRKSALEGNFGSLGEETAKKLASLKEKYKKGIPSAKDIDELHNDIAAFYRKEEQIQDSKTKKPTDDEVRLAKLFANGAPSEAEIKRIDEEFKAYKNAEQDYLDTPEMVSAALDATPVKPRVPAKRYLIAAIASIVIAAIGIGVVFVQQIAGFVLLGLGVIGIGVVGFLYVNRKASLPQAIMAARNPEKDKKKQIMGKAEAAVERLLLPYGGDGERSIEFRIDRLKEDKRKYDDYNRDLKTNKSLIESCERERNSLAKSIGERLLSFGFAEGDFNTRFSSLNNELGEYANLLKTEQALLDANSKNKAEIGNCNKEISEFVRRYKLSEERVKDLETLNNDVEEYQKAKTEEAANRKSAGDLKKEKSLDVRPTALADAEKDKIEKELDDISSNISSVSGEIGELEDKRESLDDLEADISKENAVLEKYKHEYELVKTAKEILKESNEYLKSKYIDPIKNDFVGYAKKIENAIGAEVSINPDFEVVFERNGVEHTEEHFSDGERNICAFCFRLALIDNMYVDDKPFIILDDPFTSLDQSHMVKMKNMLIDLSKQFQFVYFTCHESRDIEEVV